MKTSALAIALLLCVGSAPIALADPPKEDSGKGQYWPGYPRDDNGWRKRADTGVDRDGCKVERKWVGSVYKEERKCRR